MELPKPYDENSLFADNFLQAELSLSHDPTPKLQQCEDISAPGPSPNAANPANKMRFYQQHRKIYVVAYHLYLEKRRQEQLLEQLNQRIKLLQDRLRDSKVKDQRKCDNLSEENRAKRSRRTAELIEKKHKCNASLCSRSYGSEGSLQQHIKIKHPQLYVKDLFEFQQESQEYSDGSL